MEYIANMLGINIEEIDTDVDRKLSYAIRSMYTIRKILMDGNPAFVAIPNDELGTANAVGKHIAAIRKIEDIPVIILSDSIPSRKRERFIEERIPFVEEGKSIYLPFYAAFLKTETSVKASFKDKLTPSGQLLLIYLLLKEGNEMDMGPIAHELEVSTMTISRAARELQHRSLVRLEKSGRNIIIHKEASNRDLFEKSLPIMNNPVRHRLYIKIEDVDDRLLYGGMSALSEKSMIASPAVPVFAAGMAKDWKDRTNPAIEDEKKEVALEIWRYDPGKLSSDNSVDPISLYLSMYQDADERTEMQLEEMLNQLWS